MSRISCISPGRITREWTRITRCQARAARSSAWRVTAFKDPNLPTLMSAAFTSITSLLAQMNAPRLRALFAQEPHRTADWVYVTAAEGLPQAQLCYGRMLLEGTGVPKDQHAAFAWFQRAASRGNIDAINMVGRGLANGGGVAADPAAAAAQYRRAADAGHAWAQYNLGHLYLDGRGVPQDFDQAFAYYLRAAQ